MGTGMGELESHREQENGVKIEKNKDLEKSFIPYSYFTYGRPGWRTDNLEP